MKKQNGLRLIEVLVVIAIIAMLLAILMPARGRVKKIEQRVVCGTHLKGFGMAMTVYANDFDGHYPCLPGNGPWTKELGFDYGNPQPDFTGAQANTPRTVSASLYLLVRLADVSPKSFVCPESGQVEFPDPDLVDLWDFGADPYKHVSYAYQNPYGKYPAQKKQPSSFAILADMNPWLREGNILRPNEKSGLPPQIIHFQEEGTWKRGNSLNHIHLEKAKRTLKADYGIGQNVLHADGHNTFEKTPNVGVNQDNIYTYWSTEKDPSEQDIEGGTAPTDRGPENDARSKEDSFLVI